MEFDSRLLIRVRENNSLMSPHNNTSHVLNTLSFVLNIFSNNNCHPPQFTFLPHLSEATFLRNTTIVKPNVSLLFTASLASTSRSANTWQMHLKHVFGAFPYWHCDHKMFNAIRRFAY